MIWRFLDTGFNSAAMNMAIDEVLLGSRGPVVRFYRWKPAALSLGYFQSIKDINIDECGKQGIDIVRRVTGGKTVLHDMELTYSITIDEKEMPKSIIESYKIISKGILIALKTLGVNASMKDVIEKKTSSAICFSEPSYYEIVANGKKIVGSAQTRKKGKVLQHGSVLIGVDVDKLVSLFNVSDEDKAKARSRITSISNVVGRDVPYDDVAKAMKIGFEENFNIKFVEEGLTKNEFAEAMRLAEDKYITEEWNKLR